MQANKNANIFIVGKMGLKGYSFTRFILLVWMACLESKRCTTPGILWRNWWHCISHHTTKWYVIYIIYLVLFHSAHSLDIIEALLRTNSYTFIKPRPCFSKHSRASASYITMILMSSFPLDQVLWKAVRYMTCTHHQKQLQNNQIVTLSRSLSSSDGRRLYL